MAKSKPPKTRPKKLRGPNTWAAVKEHFLKKLASGDFKQVDPADLEKAKKAGATMLSVAFKALDKKSKAKQPVVLSEDDITAAKAAAAPFLNLINSKKK